MSSPEAFEAASGYGLSVVLVEPEIPPNTGNIARLCASTGASLHLVEPLGFELNDRTLKRAGMDYWQYVNWQRWSSLDALRESRPKARFWYFTTKTDRVHFDVSFAPGDFLVFGRETKGLPESLLAAHTDQCLTIPSPGAGARSLNLSSAAAIGLFEAIRQCRAQR